MTNETASDLSYAHTLWKSAHALRGEVDATKYNHVQTVRENAQRRMKEGDRRVTRKSPSLIPASHSPDCGSMFGQSETFVEAHVDNMTNVFITGENSNPTTWRLASRTVVIDGIAVILYPTPNDMLRSGRERHCKGDYSQSDCIAFPNPTKNGRSDSKFMMLINNELRRARK